MTKMYLQKRGNREKEWEEFQKKTILEWVNSREDIPGIPFDFETLIEQMQDGDLINKLVQSLHKDPSESIESKKLKKCVSMGTMEPLSVFKRRVVVERSVTKNSPFEKMYRRENLNLALSQMAQLGIDTSGVGVEDIISGNVKMVLSLLWKIIRYSEEKPVKNSVVEIPAPESSEETESMSIEDATLVEVSSTSEVKSQEGENFDQDGQLEKKEENSNEGEMESEQQPRRRLERKKKTYRRISFHPDVDTKSSSSSGKTDKSRESKELESLRDAMKDIVNMADSISNSAPPTVGHPNQLRKAVSHTWSPPGSKIRKPVKGLFDSEQNSPKDDGSRKLDLQKRSYSELENVKPPVDSFEPETTRDSIAYEILSTEESYKKNLDQIVLVYLRKMRLVCSEAEIKAIFSNVQNIRNFSVKLLDELREKFEDWYNCDQCIGQIFIKFHPFFKMYIPYCKDYEDSVQVIRNCSKRKDFDAILESEKRNCDGLDLDSLLITPVQRIPRYMLLLKELLKNTSSDHPDFKNLQEAVEKMTMIANTVNEGIDYYQTAKAYDFMVESIKGIKAHMAVHRKFILEGQWPVSIISRKSTQKFTSMWVLVFTDMLFVAGGANKAKRKLKLSMFLNSVWIRESANKCLEVIAPEEPSFYIRVESPEERNNLRDGIMDLIQQQIKPSPHEQSNPNARYFKYTFSHGGIYQGDWIDAKMDGYGHYFFPNGNQYQGFWKDGLMEGQGKMIYSDNEVYEGEWSNGVKHGRGKLFIQNMIYEGDFSNGCMNGTGTLSWPNGDFYRGEFKDGQMSGRGILTWKNGSKYEGEFKNNMMWGLGTMYYYNGGVYEGEWASDKKNGKGRQVYPNGDVYEGGWKDNKRHGIGEFVSSNGKETYTGEWVCDQREGKGLFVRQKIDSSEYTCYNGEWLRDKKHGGGELFLNGCIYKGNWANDCREGHGNMKECCGEYTGQWKVDKRGGPGIYVSADTGFKFQGEWEDGVEIGKGYSTQKGNNGKVVTEMYQNGRTDLAIPSFSHRNLPPIRLCISST